MAAGPMRPSPPPGGGRPSTELLRDNIRRQAEAVMGGAKMRWSSALANVGQFVLKVPKNMAANEYNVVVGLPRTVHAPGASPLMVVGPMGRDIICRDLIVQEVSLAAGAVGTADYSLLALQSSTQNLEPFGNANIMMFHPFNLNRPQFDLPVGDGSNATVQFLNNSAVAGVLAGGFNID